MTKIVGIVTVCILLVVAASAAGIYKIRQIGTELEFIANSDVPLTKAVSVVTAYRLEQSLLMERVLRLRSSGHSEDWAYVKQAKERLIFLTAEIEKEFINATDITQLAIAKSRKPELSREFESILAALRKISNEHVIFSAVTKEALAHSQAGRMEQAYEALEAVEERHAAFDMELETILIKVQDLSESAAKTAYAHEQSAVQSAIILCSLSIVIAVLMAVLLGHQVVSKPLVKVVHALHRLAANDFDADIPSGRTDEIGEIGRAFGVLKTRLRESQEQERAERLVQENLNREIKLMAELNEWLQSSSSLEELFKLVSDFLVVLLPGCKGEIYVYSSSRDVLDGVCAWNGAKTQAHIRPHECWGLRRGRNYIYGDGVVNFKCDHVHEDADAYLCIPFLAHGETIGLMHLAPVSGVPICDFLKQRKLAQIVAEQISLAIANTRMRDELHNQSIRDPLTGLFNRRHFLDRFRAAIEKSKHSGKPVSLISIDVDHFKKFNDNHGHDAGDMVLRFVGTVLDQFFDGENLPCRIGGEEFSVLMPESSPAEAAEAAEKLRSQVAAMTVRYGEKALPRVTVSSGVAGYPLHGLMPQDIIKIADDALYASKAAGRNTVTVARFGDDADADQAQFEVDMALENEAASSASLDREQDQEPLYADPEAAGQTVETEPSEERVA